MKFGLEFAQESWINFNRHKRGYHQETSLLQKGLNGWIVQTAKKKKTQRRPRSSLKQARKDAQDRKWLFQPLTAAVQAGQGTPGTHQQPSHHWGSRNKQPNSFLDQKGFICEEQQTGQGSGCSYTETPTLAKSSHSLETHHSSLLLPASFCLRLGRVLPLSVPRRCANCPGSACTAAVPAALPGRGWELAEVLRCPVLPGQTPR